MSTPTSGAASYASNADAITYCDSRPVGQVLVDTGTPLTEAQILTSTRLTQILQAASGEVESYALRGGRYTPEDLAALTGNSAQFLKMVVCWLAIGPLLWRRNPQLPKPPGLEMAEKAMQALGQGLQIFGLVEVQQAGVMKAILPGDPLTDPLYATRVNVVAAPYFRRCRDMTWPPFGGCCW